MVKIIKPKVKVKPKLKVRPRPKGEQRPLKARPKQPQKKSKAKDIKVAFGGPFFGLNRTKPLSKMPKKQKKVLKKEFNAPMPKRTKRLIRKAMKGR